MKTIAVWLSAIWLVLIFSPQNVKADCQGCCSHHGGVVCSNGITRCADGSSLSATCRSKGCSACSGHTTTPTTTTTTTTTTSTTSTTTSNTTTMVSTTSPTSTTSTTTLPSTPWINQNQCSSFDPISGMLHIPCLELGYFYWLDLSLAEANSLTFQIDNFGTETDCLRSGASFDMASSRLHLPCLDLGGIPTYWLDFAVGRDSNNSINFGLAGFGGNQLLSEADNGRTIVLSRDSIMTVRLNSNPTTGYQWSIRNLDQIILTPIGNAYVPDPNCCIECVGCGGNEIWTFRAASPGMTGLEMIYSQLWEGASPGDTFMIDVQVQ